MFRILRRLKLIYIWLKIYSLESSQMRLVDRDVYLKRLRLRAWLALQLNRKKPIGLVFQKNHRDLDDKVNGNREKLQKITAELEDWKQKQAAEETKLQ